MSKSADLDIEITNAAHEFALRNNIPEMENVIYAAIVEGFRMGLKAWGESVAKIGVSFGPHQCKPESGAGFHKCNCTHTDMGGLPQLPQEKQ